MSPNVSESSSVCYQVSLAAWVVTTLFAPLTVAANGLILAAIWRNPSLRTPSHVLLAGLAFTDFCTGLLSEPFFLVSKFVVIIGNSSKGCDAGLEHFADGIGYYFSSLTIFVMAMIAVERWLYMSRRSLLAVRRVVIIYIAFASMLIVMAAGRTYSRYYKRHNASRAIDVGYSLMGCLCLMVTAFAYFKVFQFIPHHQNQVQTINESTIDMKKYKRTILTILYILAGFALTYVPYICFLLAFETFTSKYGTSYYGALRVCAAVVFSSSFFFSIFVNITARNLNIDQLSMYLSTVIRTNFREH